MKGIELANGKQWQRARALCGAPVAGTYRIHLDAGGSNARLEPVAGRGADAPATTFPFTRSPIAGNPRIVVYVPKNTDVIDLEVRHRTGVLAILFISLPGKGNKSRTATLDQTGLHRIHLEPGEAGTLARMTQNSNATL